ncbi:tetratricopeptide repeat protein [Flexithrix dorotheae]|uniref:tetratricopeptide repeat protein n=1 Tax=Flexithrix dorotheae TaxID=70993 RepID=UPI000375FB63|nr:tetratricopeptide repeat protein [Flexithrix dorotheae]
MDYFFKSVFCISLIFIHACSSPEKTGDRLLPIPDETNNNAESQISYLTRIIEEEDPNPEYFFHRAKLFLSVEKPSAALRDINRAINLNPNQASYFFYKALALKAEENFEEALTASIKAEEGGFENVELKILAGELYLSQGDTVNALNNLRKGLENAPDNYSVSYNLGKIYAGGMDTLQALKFLNNAIKISPEKIAPYNEAMRILLKVSDYPATLNYAKKGLGNSTPNPSFSYLLGETLEFSGEIDSAAFWYLNSYKMEPVNWQPNFKLGQYYTKKRDFLKAQKFLSQAVKSNPNLKEGFSELGRINEYYLGNLAEAKNYYEKAFSLDSADTKLPFYLRRVERKLEFQRFSTEF